MTDISNNSKLVCSDQKDLMNNSSQNSLNEGRKNQPIQIDWEKEKDNLEKYVNEFRESNVIISKRYGVSSETIRRVLKKFEITRKLPSITKRTPVRCNDEEIISVVKKSNSISDLLKNLKLKENGGNRIWILGKIKKLGLDISHFSRYSSHGHHSSKKIDLKNILVDNSTYQSSKLKNRLISEGLKERRCECCGNISWNGEEIPLELHHINGNHFDNRIENLQILCPNCHSLITNHDMKNKDQKPYCVPFSKTEILDLYKELEFTYKVAERLGVDPSTVRKWINNLGIKDEVNEIRENFKKIN